MFTVRKDENHTAMQFAKVIIESINNGDGKTSYEDLCKKKLQKKMVYRGVALMKLVEELVEDSTGKNVDVDFSTHTVYKGEFQFLFGVLQWKINQ